LGEFLAVIPLLPTMTPKQPQISVAIPVHNGENYIEDAIESVLLQDYPNFKIFVSQNFSNDATQQKLEDFAKRDNRIRISQTNCLISMYANVNRAVEICDSEWVKILCHDDLLETNCLTQIANQIVQHDSPTLGLIGLGEKVLFGNGYCHMPIPKIPGSPKCFNGLELMRSVLAGQGLAPTPALSNSVVKKTAWDRFGRFNPSLSHADTFLWYELLTEYNYLYIPQPLITNRIHTGQGAVEFRRNLSSIYEYRIQFPKYISTNSQMLKLDWRSKVLCFLRPRSVAAFAIMIRILKRQPIAALKIFSKLPLGWIPIVSLLVIRSYFSELKRTSEVRKHVPLNFLYPD